MARWRLWLTVAFALYAIGVTVWMWKHAQAEAGRPNVMSREDRQILFAELQPVNLSNCEVERFGEPHDGGYLMCRNLLASVEAGYSYGIGGYDGWGCDVSRRLDVRVHQYDCFDTRRPVCPGGDTVFHEECVGADPALDGGRVFDTVQNQVAKNGDKMKHLVAKIDIEGAEWDTFLQTPDAVLEQIDQLAVEFHGMQEKRFITIIRKLKRFFYLAHLHFNNYSCLDNVEPFPAWAYQVLFVSKRLAVPGPIRTAGGPHPLDARDNPYGADCQAAVP